MPSATARRGYESPRRRAMAQETRAAVLEAARELFATRGWSVGMREIAKAAGVSVETVYSIAGSKGALLLTVIEEGLVADVDPVPLPDRPTFRALGEGTRAGRVMVLARLIEEANRRIAPLSRTLAHAASADPELAARADQYDRATRAQYAQGTQMILGRRPEQDVVDGIWAIGSPEVYLLLTETAGWSGQKYRYWLADRFEELIFDVSTLRPRAF